MIVQINNNHILIKLYLTHVDKNSIVCPEKKAKRTTQPIFSFIFKFPISNLAWLVSVQLISHIAQIHRVGNYPPFPEDIDNHCVKCEAHIERYTPNDSFETKNWFLCLVATWQMLSNWCLTSWNWQKVVHKFEKVVWKIFIMTLQLKLESRVRALNLCLIKLHKNKER